MIGVNATSPCLQGGTFARVNPIGPVVSPLDALRDRLGSAVQVDYAQGVVAPAPFTLPELGGTTPDGTPGSLLETFAPGERCGRVRRSPAVVLVCLVRPGARCRHRA